MAFRNSSFATFLIVCPTSFFLGVLFSLFPYDYPLLWSTLSTPPGHYTLYETHLRFLHASPPLIPRLLHITIFLGLAGLITKLYKPSESNMLFDGASLVLYMCGVVVYIANIVKGLRTVTEGSYGLGDTSHGDAAGYGDDGSTVLGREDNLKVLAASNTILALVLVGVLVLQAGQWYAERKEAQDQARMELEEEASASREEAEKSEREKEKEKGNGGGGGEKKKVGRQGSAAGKKKQ